MDKTYRGLILLFEMGFRQGCITFAKLTFCWSHTNSFVCFVFIQLNRDAVSLFRHEVEH